MTQPFFSILVPVYNHARYIGAALDSLLSQTDPDWEAVVVDDGSTDSTPDVLARYAARDRRIRVFRKPNGGVSTALNLGFRESAGNWICWLSSDDLFEPDKLAIHREWIAQFPDTKFFFTHFRQLDDTTKQVSEPDLWHPVPPEDRQVIEMLRGSFVHGNSVCIRRDAFVSVGPFNEALRYAQDYDLWMRLLVRVRGVYIDRRTCVTRTHPSQQTHLQNDACFFDSAKAAIQLINATAFDQIFPSLDLSDPEQARTAFGWAMDVALNPHAFCYALGPHPGLLGRIMEWVWRCDNALNRELKGHFTWCIRAALKKVQDPQWRLIYKTTLTAAMGWHGPVPFRTVEPVDVGLAHYWSIKAQNGARANALKAYLVRFDSADIPDNLPGSGTSTEFVIIASQMGDRIPKGAVYGAMQMTLETARCLMRTGRQVLLVAISGEPFGYVRGIPFLGMPDHEEVIRSMGRLAPIDILIAISRADVLLSGASQRCLIYHHNPYPIQGHVPVWILNLAKIPVVCVSMHSRKRQIELGIHPDLIHVVPNAYDATTFVPQGDVVRNPRAIVYAGHSNHYKGVDRAIRTFQKLKKLYPDAVLDVYGSGTLPWRVLEPDDLDDAWLENNNYIKWESVERDCPGLHYQGEQSAGELAKAFRSASLLIMPVRADETFGIVSLEAQACGCIPVLPRQGGLPETIRTGETGYLYEENTIDGLVAAVSELWNKELPSREMRRHAAEWVSEKFRFEITGQTFLETVKTVRKISAWGRILIHTVALYKRITNKIQRI